MMPPQSQSPPSDTAGQPETLAGVTTRAVVLSVALTFAIYLLTTKPGFVRINWLPYTTPPVQPFFLLLLLQGANVLLQRCARLPAILRPFTRAELFFIYAALSISLPMERGGYVIHYLTSGQYFATDANKWGEIFAQYPDWFMPRDEGVIRRWMEGSASGHIPWEAWQVPLAVWFGFQMVMVFTVMCLVGLLRKQWSEGERLTYPLLFIPLEITGGRQTHGFATGFFRNPIMWIGFGLAAAFNGLNILHAYFPGIPGIARYLTLDPYLNEGLLRHVRPLGISFALEICGLAYLVSGEVLLSGWLLYFAMKLIKVIGLSMGYRESGFPFFQEVSAGGYVALAVFLVWIARPHLAEVWRQVWDARGREENEALPYRWLVIGLVFGSVAMVLFWVEAGLKPILPVIFLVCLYIFTLVAARVRAEAGPPVVWCHPYGYDQQMPLQLLGSRAIKSLGGDKSLALFGVLFWIGRAAYPHQVAQYFVDSLQLAHHGRARRSHMTALLLLVCAVALGLTFWYHLDVGYSVGQVLIGSRSGEQSIGWGFSWSRGEYQVVRAAMDRPTGPNFTQMGFYGAGFLITSLLTVARIRITSFPLHPLGFLLATLYGDYSPYWFPFLFAWTCQRLLLRYGGLKLYRRFVPLFLGLAFGHMLIGGFLWRIVINYFIDPSISRGYYLNLGG